MNNSSGRPQKGGRRGQETQYQQGGNGQHGRYGEAGESHLHLGPGALGLLTDFGHATEEAKGDAPHRDAVVTGQEGVAQFVQQHESEEQ